MVATYKYDPWGKVTSSTGTMASINPLRYRGYYYDSETGFYYLMSRYYDPEIGRFINADVFASTGQGILGNNMFMYCLNNPVIYVDHYGTYSRQRGFWNGYDQCGGYSDENSFFEDFLTHLARPRKKGNTFSAGLSGSTTSSGTTGGKSFVLSADTSYNYALQKSSTIGTAPGIGSSAGLVLMYTNATNVKDLEGYSKATGVTLVARSGISIDYITFVPNSNPDTTCWGISVVISFGGEFDVHATESITATSESWNPILALRDYLYGG